MIILESSELQRIDEYYLLVILFLTSLKPFIHRVQKYKQRRGGRYYPCYNQFILCKWKHFQNGIMEHEASQATL